MTPEERVKELEDGMLVVQQKFSALLEENADLKLALSNASADLNTERYRVKLLKEGLSFYLPGPFWDTVVQDTKADIDQGKHAEWILRLAADEHDTAGA